MLVHIDNGFLINMSVVTFDAINWGSGCICLSSCEESRQA